jgi:hypothetical protein
VRVIAGQEISPQRVFVLDLKEAKGPQPFLAGPLDRYPIGFTTDNRYLAYWSYETGQPKTYLRPFPGGEGKWEVPGEVWDGTHRFRGGKDILMMAESAGQMRLVEVPVDTKTGVSFGKTHDLFTIDPERVDVEAGFDEAPDGRHFVFVQGKISAEQNKGIVVVQNWFAEFKDKQRK